MLFVHGFFIICVLIILARLIELQLVRGAEYREQAQSQQYGGVVLQAKRGDILSRDSKTGEQTILATNTTLDMVYVDPLVVDDPFLVAEALTDVLITEDIDALCRQGNIRCPRELTKYYQKAFDPLLLLEFMQSGALLPVDPVARYELYKHDLPDKTEVRRRFARDIEERISETRVRYVPLLYGANKQQMQTVSNLGITGVTVSWEDRLIYADPEEIHQLRLPSFAHRLAEPLEMDPSVLVRLLRTRPLRYVSIMHQLSPDLSERIRDLKSSSQKLTAEKRQQAPNRDAALRIQDPFRCIALLPEYWRYYPDGTIASHVVGFLNTTQEAQYGIERTFHSQLRGQDGRISALSDLEGGQIVTGDQLIVDPVDGDSIVLTVDRFVQKKVEDIMNEAVTRFEADSGQAIVMDPRTGRIIAMVNAPIFDSNVYGGVYAKEPVILDEKGRKDLVVELYHPDTNSFVLRAYIDSIFTASGRTLISDEKQEELRDIEQLYDLDDITRYYMYLGENNRWEVFPTENPNVWLKYSNNIGVGAYLNRTIQEIYEPGSVFKPITMAIALDQGEIRPSDTYLDHEPVKVDEYTIKNALNTYYGEVTMTNCLEYSVNTCMTTVSTKLGRKLFRRMIERFGFSQITGIELEDELPGELLPWKKWSQALLATAAYGQGISATPLQVITAFSALANDGKLMRPFIVDHVVKSDGTVKKSKPHVVDQVITPETAETITAMLTSTVTNGFAKTAKVPGHRIAGKTGTSQIAGPGGKYESGTGASITSFAGYAPIEDPRFVALVKIDRPRNVEYGSESAAPVFREIATFLFQYYGIPPDEE